MGGAAYASLRIPNGSVGEKQIQNRVIDPVKWDPNYTTGFVRRWATVNSSGALMSTSPGGQSKSIGTGAAVVTWGDAFAGWCAPVATVLGGSANPSTTPTSTSTSTTTTTTTSVAADPDQRRLRRRLDRDQVRPVDIGGGGHLQLARPARQRAVLDRGGVRPGRRLGSVVPD